MSSNQSFIVIFKNTASDQTIVDQRAQVVANGGTITHVYDSPGLKGFAAEIPLNYLATLESSLLEGDSQISSIEPDQIVKIQDPST